MEGYGGDREGGIRKSRLGGRDRQVKGGDMASVREGTYPQYHGIHTSKHINRTGPVSVYQLAQWDQMHCF